MIETNHYIHMARFVLQAETAFALHTGLSDGSYDNSIVRDANKLPAISASSLAGVLRHRYNSDRVKDVFGYADGDHLHDKASRVTVSWGCIHDSKNKAVEGLQDLDVIKHDALLERLAQDHFINRERVALNKRGVAKKNMKYDVTLAPAGCRFSFEIGLWSDTAEKQDDDWQALLTLLQSPLQIGSSVRSGIGRFKLQQLCTASFDLKNTEHYQQYSKVSRQAIDDVSDFDGPTVNDAKTSDITIKLEAEDFWRFGQTGSPLKSADKDPQAVPTSEVCINWTESTGALCAKRKIIIPASGVKGALAHRLEFHYRCLTEQYADAENTQYDDETRTKEDVVAPLLGYAADTNQGDSEGLAGLLFFRDMYLDYTDADITHLMHNSIDRFTGGVRDSVLFSEEMIWKKSWQLHIDLDWARMGDAKINEQLQQLFKALHLTLQDLEQGRLPLGAASSKGHGYFEIVGDRQYSEKLQQQQVKQWMEQA